MSIFWAFALVLLGAGAFTLGCIAIGFDLTAFWVDVRRQVNWRVHLDRVRNIQPIAGVDGVQLMALGLAFLILLRIT
jgi:hypothetical protein